MGLLKCIAKLFELSQRFREFLTGARCFVEAVQVVVRVGHFHVRQFLFGRDLLADGHHRTRRGRTVRVGIGRHRTAGRLDGNLGRSRRYGQDQKHGSEQF